MTVGEAWETVAGMQLWEAFLLYLLVVFLAAFSTSFVRAAGRDLGRWWMVWKGRPR